MQKIKYEIPECSNGCFDKINYFDESDLKEFYSYYQINISSNEEDNISKNGLDEKNKDKNEYIRNEDSEENKETQLNNDNKLNSFNDINIPKKTNEVNISPAPKDKIENEDCILDSISKIQNNKPKNKFPKNNISQKGISNNTTKCHFSTSGKKEDQTPKKLEEEPKINDDIISGEQKNDIIEDKEIKSVTDNGSEDDSDFEIEEEEDEINSDIILEEDKKKDNSRKEALKAPIPGIKHCIEKTMNIKLDDINLNALFGGVEQNKKVLNWKMYQIFCYSKINRIKLRDLEPSNKKDKKIYYFLLTRKYKFLFRNYYKNKKSFIINGENEIIENFPILNKILDEREKNIYKKENKEQKINIFKQASKSVYMNFRYVKSRKSNCKKLKKVTLRKFKEYIDNELKNKII